MIITTVTPWTLSSVQLLKDGQKKKAQAVTGSAITARRSRVIGGRRRNGNDLWAISALGVTMPPTVRQAFLGAIESVLEPIAARSSQEWQLSQEVGGIGYYMTKKRGSDGDVIRNKQTVGGAPVWEVDTDTQTVRHHQQKAGKTGVMCSHTDHIHTILPPHRGEKRPNLLQRRVVDKGEIYKHLDDLTQGHGRDSRQAGYSAVEP